MHRLVILGSLGEFTQLIRMAKKRGIYTIVCDGYPHSIGKSYADKSYDIPVGEIDKVAEMCIREQADGIITSFSDYLFECMVKIAEKANLKCYFDTAHLDLYRNKNEMKDMLASLGIQTSSYCQLEKDFADEELKDLHFPVVVKPLDKYGSRGVEVLHSTKQIRERFDYTCETSDVKRILVEEYHDGCEFNMMTWVLHGKVQVISIADREKTPIDTLEVPISTRNVYPTKRLDAVLEEAKGILQKVADYTGQQTGPLSMQFFWRPETGVSVCEVAGRFFGYEHELVDLAGGLNMESLLLDYVYEEEKLDELFANYSPRFPRTCAVLYFHGRPGMVIANQKKAYELAAKPGVVDSWIFYREGEQIVKHGANPYVVRYYISGETREEIDELTQEIFEAITIKDENGAEVLYRNQMGK